MHQCIVPTTIVTENSIEKWETSVSTFHHLFYSWKFPHYLVFGYLALHAMQLKLSLLLWKHFCYYTRCSDIIVSISLLKESQSCSVSINKFTILCIMYMLYIDTKSACNILHIIFKVIWNLDNSLNYAELRFKIYTFSWGYNKMFKYHMTYF